MEQKNKSTPSPTQIIENADNPKFWDWFHIMAVKKNDFIVDYEDPNENPVTELREMFASIRRRDA